MKGWARAHERRWATLGLIGERDGQRPILRIPKKKKGGKKKEKGRRGRKRKRERKREMGVSAELYNADALQ